MRGELTMHSGVTEGAGRSREVNESEDVGDF